MTRVIFACSLPEMLCNKGNRCAMIWMTGIDQTSAPLAIRSAFTYRKQETVDFMAILREKTGAQGIVLLTTCNRTELYLHLEEETENFCRQEGMDAKFPQPDHGNTEPADASVCSLIPETGRTFYREKAGGMTQNRGNAFCGELTALLCRSKGLDPVGYQEYFTERNGKAAVAHLFALTAGLKSSIVAEDQILAQVKEALFFSREMGYADSELEVCFQRAISAAKKVKSEVTFSYANRSAISEALSRLAEEGFDPVGKTCLVIGNGEYGRLAAQTLAAQGASVTMTIRQYHSGMVLLPEGCKKILYGDRMRFFPQCDLVISATKSPNYTLYYEPTAACKIDHPMILIDFAVPRDIDPRIGEINGIHVYTVDDFKTRGNPENEAAYAQAMYILEEAQAEYWQRAKATRLLGPIVRIGACAGQDAQFRMRRDAKKLAGSATDQKQLLERIGDVTQKVTEKLLFRLRDGLDEETFLRCLAVLEEAAELEEEKYGGRSKQG